MRALMLPARELFSRLVTASRHGSDALVSPRASAIPHARPQPLPAECPRRTEAVASAARLAALAFLAITNGWTYTFK